MLVPYVPSSQNLVNSQSSCLVPPSFHVGSRCAHLTKPREFTGSPPRRGVRNGTIWRIRCSSRTLRIPFAKVASSSFPGAAVGPHPRGGVQNGAISRNRCASRTFRIPFEKVVSSSFPGAPVGPREPPWAPPRAGGSRMGQFRGSAVPRERYGFLLQKWAVRHSPFAPDPKVCPIFLIGTARVLLFIFLMRII